MKILCNIFSVKKNHDLSRTVVTVFGLKFKIKTLDIMIKDFLHSIIAQECFMVNEIYDLHSKVFPKYKDINKEKSVAVFGCGPTLKYYNNELNTSNIALNKALFLENISFNYSFALDVGLCKTFPGYLDKIKEKECVKFIGRALNNDIEQFPEIINEKKYNIERFYSSNRKKMYALDFGKEFHSRLECYPLVDVQTVAFSALQFALYTHPKKLYLIGLDTCNNGHFFDSTSHYLVNQTITQYKKFKNFASIYYPDVEIISVNPIGLKGLFKDVYTQSFVDENVELKKEKITIL